MPEGRAVGDELGQQARGERHQRDGEEKAEMNPGEVARAFADVVELGLLAGPEDAQGEKAHAVGDPLRAQCGRALRAVRLGVHLGGGGDVQVEHQQRHGHGKDAVAQRGQPFHVAALDAVVEGGHGNAFRLKDTCG